MGIGRSSRNDNLPTNGGGSTQTTPTSGRTISPSKNYIYNYSMPNVINVVH
jgi:hypothetical protein